MNLMNLYAELQLNPQSTVIYRKLSEYYRNLGKTNEADAFLELIKRRFDANSSHPNEKQ